MGSSCYNSCLFGYCTGNCNGGSAFVNSMMTIAMLIGIIVFCYIIYRRFPSEESQPVKEGQRCNEKQETKP